MADERATVTLTLDDQVSEPLRQIAARFGELRKSMEEAGRAKGEDPAEKVRRTKKEMQEAETGIQRMTAGLGKLQGTIHSAVTEFTVGLATTTKGLSGFETAIGQSIVTGNRFVGAMGSWGTVVGSIALTAAAAAGGVYLLGRRMADAHRDTQRLRTEFGALNDQYIDIAIETRRRLGESTEQALSSMRNWSTLYFDSWRESLSALGEALGSIGEEGLVEFNKIREAYKSGMDANQAYDESMARMAKWPEEVRYRAERALRMYRGQIAEYAAANKAVRDNPPWQPSAERRAALEKMQGEVTTLVNSIRTSLDNLWREGWFELQVKVGPVIKDLLGDFKTFTDFLKENKGAIAEFFGEEAVKTIRDFSTIAKEIAAALRLYRRVKRFVTPTPGTGEVTPILPGISEGAPPIIGFQKLPWMQSVQDWFARGGISQYDLPGFRPPVQQQSFMGEEGGARLQPIVLREIDQEQREGNVYLRETRDVLVWLRSQLEPKTGGTQGIGGTQSANLTSEAAPRPRLISGQGRQGRVATTASAEMAALVGGIDRSSLAKQLDNATVRNLAELTKAEVGGVEGTAAQRLLAAHMNRTLIQTGDINKQIWNKYYPHDTTKHINQPGYVSSAELERFRESTLAAIMRGEGGAYIHNASAGVATRAEQKYPGYGERVQIPTEKELFYIKGASEAKKLARFAKYTGPEEGVGKGLRLDPEEQQIAAVPDEQIKSQRQQARDALADVNKYLAEQEGNIGIPIGRGGIGGEIAREYRAEREAAARRDEMLRMQRAVERVAPGSEEEWELRKQQVLKDTAFASGEEWKGAPGLSQWQGGRLPAPGEIEFTESEIERNAAKGEREEYYSQPKWYERGPGYEKERFNTRTGEPLPGQGRPISYRAGEDLSLQAAPPPEKPEVNFNFNNVPAGTKINADGDGIFDDMTVTRSSAPMQQDEA